MVLPIRLAAGHLFYSLKGIGMMSRWVVIFRDTDKMLDIRANLELRNKHVAYAKNHPELLIGGGLKADPDGAFCGAMWIVQADTKDEVERLILADPFYVSDHRTFEIFTWGKILEDKMVTL